MRVLDRMLDFSLERIRSMEPDIESTEYLLEIAWLYDRIVQSGSKVPVIDLAFELVMSEDFVADCVCVAMEEGLICAPKKGSNGGRISKRALKKLKQGT